MPTEVFLPISVACAAIVLFWYYRIGRVFAGVGWALVLLSVGGFGSGLAQSFAWSGLVFLFVAGLGAIMIVQDIAFRRRKRRQQRESSEYDLERNG